MMGKKRRRSDNLRKILTGYAESRTLELFIYNDGLHLRLVDEAFTTIDFWPSTGKYWILNTNYVKQTKNRVAERGNEKGYLPLGEDKVFEYLDQIFYAADISDENYNT